MGNGWKVAALILGSLLIIESAFIFWAFMAGDEIYYNRSYCSKTCGLKNASAFWLDETTRPEICSCYNEKNQIIYQEIIK